MQTLGPYRLLGVIASCDLGQVWTAADPGGRQVTVAVLEPGAAGQGWRDAFAATANALAQATPDPLPIVNADFTGTPAWVACAAEPNGDAGQIFRALGRPYTATASTPPATPPATPLATPLATQQPPPNPSRPPAPMVSATNEDQQPYQPGATHDLGYSTNPPVQPGLEPPQGGGWPSDSARFVQADRATPMKGLAGLGFDFSVPLNWQCTLDDQRSAWAVRWIRSGSFAYWGETTEINDAPRYGLVYVQYWRSNKEQGIDRQLVFRMSAPPAGKGDLQKVVNSIRDATFTI